MMALLGNQALEQSLQMLIFLQIQLHLPLGRTVHTKNLCCTLFTDLDCVVWTAFTITNQIKALNLIL